MSWPMGARKWSSAEIRADVAHARTAFQERRLGEPMARYLQAFETIEKANVELTGRLSQLFAEPVDAQLLASILRDHALSTAFRYLAAPPISADDLETLAGTKLSWTHIRDNTTSAAAVRDVLKAVLDPKRYPWVAAGRDPTHLELHAAVLAASVAAAAQRVQTRRRSDERRELQGAAEALLESRGFLRVPKPKHGIRNLGAHAPPPGTFMSEVLVGEHNADLVVGLPDHRVLALECKGSNSEINSRKRINKEVAQDTRDWLERFGSDNLVPAALIQGVFSARYIEQAQETPVVFFWAHRLSDLETFLGFSGTLGPVRQ